MLTRPQTQARLGAERSAGLYPEFSVEWIREALIPYCEYRHLDFAAPISIGQCRSGQELHSAVGYSLVSKIDAFCDAV